MMQVPGGRENATMVDRIMFENFSLPDHDGHYFLRSDNILCAMIIKDVAFAGTVSTNNDLEADMIHEKESDLDVSIILDKKRDHLLSNEVRIASAFTLQAKTLESDDLRHSFSPTSTDEIELTQIKSQEDQFNGRDKRVSNWVNPMHSERKNRVRTLSNFTI